MSIAQDLEDEDRAIREQRRLDELTLAARNLKRDTDSLGDRLGAKYAPLANLAYAANELLSELDRKLRELGGRP